MSVTKVNKSQLTSTTTDLMSKVSGVNGSITSLNSVLKSIPNHSEFGNLVTKASMIADSISEIYVDLEYVSKNMNTYVNCLVEIDDENLTDKEESTTTTSSTLSTTTGSTTAESSSEKEENKKTNWTTATTLAGAATLSSSSSNYRGTSTSGGSYTSGSSYSGGTSSSGNYTYSYSTGPTGTVVHTNFSSSLLTDNDYSVGAGGKYNYKGIEKSLETVDGVTVTLPAGLGSVHTYMGWQCITAVDSKQYKLREAAGMIFDEEGFAKIGDRYVVAVTTTFGNVGDYIDVYQEDGTVIKCIIGDIKSQKDADCTKWGHDNGQCVLEFVVDKSSWYGDRMHSNPGTSSCHPEWNQNITKIVNKGNFFQLIKTDAAKMDESTSGNGTKESVLVTI